MIKTINMLTIVSFTFENNYSVSQDCIIILRSQDLTVTQKENSLLNFSV